MEKRFKAIWEGETSTNEITEGALCVLEHEDAEELQRLKVGESTNLYGGAAPILTVTRTQ